MQNEPMYGRAAQLLTVVGFDQPVKNNARDSLNEKLHCQIDIDTEKSCALYGLMVSLCLPIKNRLGSTVGGLRVTVA